MKKPRLIPLAIPWNRMQAWSLYDVGSITNPPAMRGYIAVQMILADQLVVMYTVGLN